MQMAFVLDPYAREWKTGHRVEFDGVYRDQRGVESTHFEHGTFPPLVRTNTRQGGGCAFYKLVMFI